jgi:hypothetical protein
MKKTNIEDGYILTDGDSEVDIESMIEAKPSRTMDYGSSSASIQAKEIKLYKDDIEYVGCLKKFILKETADGKTVVTVVFTLNS